MDLPLKQGPRGEVKSEGQAQGAAATSSSSEAQTTALDGEPSSAQSVVCKVHLHTLLHIFSQSRHPLHYNKSSHFSQDEKPDSTRSKMESEPSKAEGKEDEEEEGPLLKVDADEGSSTAHLGAEGVKQECDDEQESKENSG